MENGMVGKRFGKLVVLKEYKAGKWLVCTCRCDCGKVVEVRRSSLTSGNTTSCGCAVDPSKTLQDRVDGTRLGGITPKRKARGASGVKGVSWNRRRSKWEAYIQLRGHQYHLGLYDTLEAASEARRKAEEDLFAPILEQHKKSPSSH